MKQKKKLPAKIFDASQHAKVLDAMQEQIEEIIESKALEHTKPSVSPETNKYRHLFIKNDYAEWRKFQEEMQEIAMCSYDDGYNKGFIDARCEVMRWIKDVIPAKDYKEVENIVIKHSHIGKGAKPPIPDWPEYINTKIDLLKRQQKPRHKSETCLLNLIWESTHQDDSEAFWDSLTTIKLPTTQTTKETRKEAQKRHKGLESERRNFRDRFRDCRKKEPAMIQWMKDNPEWLRTQNKKDWPNYEKAIKKLN